MQIKEKFSKKEISIIKKTLRKQWREVERERVKSLKLLFGLGFICTVGLALIVSFLSNIFARLDYSGLKSLTGLYITSVFASVFCALLFLFSLKFPLELEGLRKKDTILTSTYDGILSSKVRWIFVFEDIAVIFYTKNKKQWSIGGGKFFILRKATNESIFQS
ncbi:hypothetical protein [Lactococcus garvieae]|uniref:hypothetical protein n=1 Tax=Lactococcus garvieae TaxID=1363 RepID=UPI0009C06945|nr:hypothetical protein [Lactococcus garvieae]